MTIPEYMKYCATKDSLSICERSELIVMANELESIAKIIERLQESEVKT